MKHSKLGARHNQDKLKWSLVDFDSLEPMVRVLMFGEKKYSAFNWAKGLKRTEVMESLLRHAHAYLEGQDNDVETKINHIGHIMCNGMFLAYMHKHRPDLDDRFKRRK
jgi:hypothetical protein